MSGGGGGASGHAGNGGAAGSSSPDGSTGAGGSEDAGTDSGAVGANGCGLAPPPVGLDNPFTLDVTYPAQGTTVTGAPGTTVTRQFYVSLPSDYDPNRPYRLILGFHAETSSAAEMVGQGFLGIQPSLPDAIYVAPQAAGPNSQGIDISWTTSNGRDVAYVTALIPWMESRFCVDRARVMAVGLSFGAVLTDFIGCHMSATVRAIAAVNGPSSTIYVGDYEGTCQNHEASWSGYFDQFGGPVPPFGPPELFRDMNHCAVLPQQIDPPLCSPSDQCDVNPPSCFAYPNCDVGYPVSACVGTGVGSSDAMPTFMSTGMATFFSQF